MDEEEVEEEVDDEEEEAEGEERRAARCFLSKSRFRNVVDEILLFASASYKEKEKEAEEQLEEKESGGSSGVGMVKYEIGVVSDEGDNDDAKLMPPLPLPLLIDHLCSRESLLAHNQ